MSLLTVRHLTVYKYKEPVGFGEHRMMFRPRESHDLRLIKEQLTITPKPSSLRWVHDVFDNSLAIATFDDPITATELRFDSTIQLEHVETTLPHYPLEEYARTFPFCYEEDELPDLARGLLRHYPGDEIAHWAKQFLGPSGTTETIGMLRSMTAAIKTEFRYKRRIAKGIQSPSETLLRQEGTCRDFALLMIEAARSIGLAARFVSGYIFVPNRKTAEGITGGGATHAWMQAYLPGAGWVDFDPTNNIIGNRNLIRVAVAWDPKQALPLWGTYVGPATAFLSMDVSVHVSDDTVT